MRILAGDIGGTKTLLALYEVDVSERTDASPPRLREVKRERFASAEFASLMPMLQRFLAAESPFQCATLAVAGPVINGVCKATNLPWIVDANEMAQFFDIKHFGLINDFQAIAMAVEVLGSEDLHTLHPGAPNVRGVRAVIGAGTGLGQALLVPMGNQWTVLASEGGHTDFAPRDDIEMKLLSYLLTKHRRVSYERVLSGRGLVNLYQFLVSSGMEEPSAKVEQALTDPSDDAASITAEALAKTNAACMRAVAMFVSLYGAEAGNLALKCLPYGGVYVAGGIAPKILPMLGGFVQSFLNKGRMSPLLERVPVHVILDTHVGLRGAALNALRLSNT